MSQNSEEAYAMRPAFLNPHAFALGCRGISAFNRVAALDASFLGGRRRLRPGVMPCRNRRLFQDLAMPCRRHSLATHWATTRAIASASGQVDDKKTDIEEHPKEQEPDIAELKSYIRDRAAVGAVRKIVSSMESVGDGVGTYGHVVPDADLYRLSVRSLLRNSRTDLAFHVYKLRMAAREKSDWSIGSDVGLAASVLRAIIRDGRKRNQVQADTSILYSEISADCDEVAPQAAVARNNANAIVTVIVALLGSDKLSQTGVRDANKMVSILKKLTSSVGHEAAVSVENYNTCVRLLGKKRQLRSVFDILDCMRAADVEFNNETFEFLANCIVRQVEFVTGAVSMETLPEPLLAEVAFVGRSNVGKSSLVNMICNRRALAYVSGRPGKTQQFNYFLVNGKDRDSAFYMVDLPGVGFARVSKSTQASWLSFMDQYLSVRSSLNVIFHLIDGRHGAMADDELLMQRVARSGFAGQYVIVLTKVDKLDKQRVRQSLLDKTRATLARNGCPGGTPVIPTSASTKLGRDEIWRFLQFALRIK